MRLIGVAGPARAGKDSIASWMRSNMNAHVDHFAKPIKDAISGWLTLAPGVWDSTESKETKLPGIGKSPREMAQLLGTEFGRELVHPDFWVLAMGYRLAAAGRPAIVVIPDVRFENESAFIRGLGGYVIHVTRPGADGNVGIKGHASEAGVAYQPGDLLFDNCGTLEDMHRRLRAIYFDAFDAAVA